MGKLIVRLMFCAGMLVVSLPMLAQVGGHNAWKPDVYSDRGNYAGTGWYFTPGVTYTLGIDQSERTQLAPDTLMIRKDTPRGMPGAFFQVGRFHKLDNKWINYIDYGLDLRWLRGQHHREVEIKQGIEDPTWLVATGDGHFSDLWLGVSANASFARHLNQSVFITHSIGVNGNYAVVRDFRATGIYGGAEDLQHPEISAQLHYKLGIGFSLGRGWWLVPTVETPILGIHAWHDGIPALKFFDNYYQPILFGIQLVRQDRKRPEDCPVEGPSRGDRRGNTELWQKKMRR